MKIIYTCLFLIWTLVSYGQNKVQTNVHFPVDSASHKIRFSEVVNIPNQNAKNIFEKLRTWGASTGLIQTKQTSVADMASGEIDISAETPLVLNIDGRAVSFCYVNYSITLYVKDNKYKYIVSNLNHKGCNRGQSFGPMASIGPLENILLADSKDRNYYDRVLSLTKEHIEAMIADMKKAVGGDEKNF